MEREKPLGMRIGESVFCVGYLAFALVAGAVFASAAARGGASGAYAAACAACTLLLGCGDAFHLVPRIAINVRGAARSEAEQGRRAFWLGLGNLVSSITMTLFYLLLFRAMELVHNMPERPASRGVFAVLCLLAAVRVVLCLLPQNRWFSREGGGAWGLYRNIPFVAMGAITVFYLVAWYGEWALALLVLASFACYMAVVVGARKNPVLGMLMIPKTICYIAVIGILLGRL